MQAMTLERAGFVELSRDEAVAVNGGWSIWTVAGMVVAGWVKLIALTGSVIEDLIWSDGEAFEYYWPGMEGWPGVD
jgi:hypothetical protein